MGPSETTNVNIIGLAFILAMGILLLALPRRSAIIPLLLTCCFITLGQRIDVAGLNFTLMRVAILFGWIRVVAYGEFKGFRRNSMDTCLLCFVLASIVMYTLLKQTWSDFISILGPAYNAVGSYFLFRFLVHDLDEADRVLRVLCIIMVPLALAMLLEKITARNLFSVFGGVPEITMLREGRLRAQGPFSHPILAGTFGAASIPLFIGLWFKTNAKKLGTVGIVAAVAVMIASASSGPLLACGAGVLGLCMWPFRQRMRAVCWFSLFSLVSLHLVMKAPIWFLIGRVSGIIGGTGWARSELIDQAVKHFDEWWLIGTTYTAHWAANNGLITIQDEPNMVDITNQYLFIGINGGVLPMTLFIVLIALAFRAVGRTVKQMNPQHLADGIIVWSMGATVFAYASSFLSVALFDQTIVIWYMLLAVISSVSMLPERITAGVSSSRERLATAPPVSLRPTVPLKPNHVHR
jgi:hypothetical protein